MSARQDADLDRDRADLVDSASVHPDSLVENSPADGLLLDETEETLANSRLAAGCIEQASRLLAFLAVGADRNGDRILQILDPAREIAREASQDGGRGFGVGQSAVDGLDLDAEEAGNVPELVRLKVRVCLTGDHESVEVAALDELPGLAEGLVEEAQVEAHVVANHGSATDERPQLFRRLASDRGAGHVGVRDAVHLRAEDVPARTDEGREAVHDRAVANANGPDLDQVGNLGVATGRLGVDDDKLPAWLADLLDKLQDGACTRLEVAHGLCLTHSRAHLFLDVDKRLESPVAEEDRVGHDVFGHDRCAGLDHHDGVAGAGDDQVDVRALKITHRGIDDELAIDTPDSNGADWPKKRNRTDRQGARRGEGSEDVRLILLVRG